MVCPGRGKPALKASLGEIINLEDVNYLPGAAVGLLSAGILTQAGGQVKFLADAVAAIKVGGNKLAVTRPNTAHELDACAVLPKVYVGSTRENVGDPLMSWHRRFGHIAPDTILELARKDVLKGAILTDKNRLTTSRARSPCLLGPRSRTFELRPPHHCTGRL